MKTTLLHLSLQKCVCIYTYHTLISACVFKCAKNAPYIGNLTGMDGWIFKILLSFQHHRLYWARLQMKGNEQNGWNTPLNIDSDPEQTWTWENQFLSPVCKTLDHASSPTLTWICVPIKIWFVTFLIYNKYGQLQI